MTRVLLTGATGYVGGELLPVLFERGHAVRAMTRDPSRARLPDGVEDQRRAGGLRTGGPRRARRVDSAKWPSASS